MTPLLGYRIAGAFALAAVTAHSFNFVGIGPATLSSPYPLPWVVLVMVGIPYLWSAWRSERCFLLRREECLKTGRGFLAARRSGSRQLWPPPRSGSSPAGVSELVTREEGTC
jgi:hypothetical protein